VSKDIYDSIGIGYSTSRQPDPRIGARIREAIGNARSVLNVGAGTGSYEPEGIWTVAVEPSAVMIDQRAPDAAPVVQARAEQLPFADAAFDVAMAILTVHHWDDAAVGVAEMRRVSRRQVVMTWDPRQVSEHFWFDREYLPEASTREMDVPTAGPIAQMLGPSTTIMTVPIPADCTDGFYAAYWARPEAYLDAGVRSAISAIALCDQDAVTRAVDRLQQDLTSGVWDRRHGDLRRRDSLDTGYRILVSESHPAMP
jgi:SAM-dependent methyltransferase